MAASSEVMEALFASTRRSTSEYRQTISPQYLKKARSDQDTANHDFIGIPGQGKGRLVVAVDNQPNQQITVTIYGVQTATSTPASSDAFPIGSFTVALASKGYETINDPFPFYIVRTAYTIQPSDATAKTWTTYVNLQSA